MALKPATPIEPYEDLLPELDMVLVMTVEPGFGGQKFLDLCLPKIRRARELIGQARPRDCGSRSTAASRLETIERCAEAGADVFVAGSAVFGADDPDAMIAALRDGRRGGAGRADRRRVTSASAPVWQAGPATSEQLACSGVGEIPSRR